MEKDRRVFLSLIQYHFSSAQYLYPSFSSSICKRSIMFSVTQSSNSNHDNSDQLNRKRKIIRNPKKSKASQNSNPNTRSPEDRVKQYPEEPFCVSNGSLFCNACRQVIGLKKTIIDNHLKSQRHVSKKPNHFQNQIRDQSIIQMLKTSSLASEFVVGPNVPDSSKLFRYHVVNTCLATGIPLNKLEGRFRELLEEGNSKMTDRSHMSKLIPLIQVCINSIHFNFKIFNAIKM